MERTRGLIARKNECAVFVQYASNIRDIFAVPATFYILEKEGN
jgi:hypothetical protein